MKIKLIATATALALAGAVALPLSGFADDSDASSTQSGHFQGMGNSGHMMSMPSMMGNGVMDRDMMQQMHTMMSESGSMTDMMSNMRAVMSAQMEQMREWMSGDDTDKNRQHPSEPAQN
ncbi:DUF4175 domain-containing protein [Cohaesibacter sp. CAU 1516]|uniref:DUF4175 domain-containing protein n=1 Tax=Cohaesibacter sp. CAU 1516 TaxID=2576038 RepID=UPI0010FF2346|nr:DUF4175 domain-containing protein [Cohaesibacter sp. CAU 1516]TLP42347.1 DUF4175 domain-containing protein [Cohaesibacter sp. CAU 1516]